MASDPAWGVVQGLRCQFWLRVMLSHMKLSYPGRPQVRGSEINRSAVGFQFILLLDFVRARPLLYSYPTIQLPYCFTMSACADFIPEMQSEFRFFTFPRIDRIIYDRCHPHYFKQVKGFEKLRSVNRMWSFDNIHVLVDEVLIMMQRETEMGVVRNLFP